MLLRPSDLYVELTFTPFSCHPRAAIPPGRQVSLQGARLPKLACWTDEL